MNADDLAGQLQQVLADPDRMAQLRDLAQSLGFSPEDAAAKPPVPQEPGIDEAMLRRAMGMMQRLQVGDRRQEDLIRALRPYLSPERQRALDQAAQLARLSSIAGAALERGNLFGGD